MDLYETYDCLLHDFIVANFEAYGLDKTGLSFI